MLLGFVNQSPQDDLSEEIPTIKAEIDQQSVDEVRRYSNKDLITIFDYYSSEEELLNWSPKMFGRCCSEADLWYSEIMSFKIETSVKRKEYPVSNLTDRDFRSAYVFKEDEAVRIDISLDPRSYYFHKEDDPKNPGYLIDPIDTILYPFTISLINGYVKSSSLFERNSRIKTMELSLNGEEKAIIELLDTPLIQSFEVDFVFKKNDKVRLIPKSYYSGSKYDDVCISEFQSNLGKIVHPSFNKKYGDSIWDD